MERGLVDTFEGWSQVEDEVFIKVWEEDEEALVVGSPAEV